MVYRLARMAEIFIKIFGDKLAKENLVELNNLDQLPSPHQLKGKIVLKGKEPSIVKSPKGLPVSKIYCIILITKHLILQPTIFKKMSLSTTKQHFKEIIINSKSKVK